MNVTLNSAILYLDESGDLGWKFTAPYGAGGSSRFLTIGAVCVPPTKKHLPKRVIRDLYNRFGWPTTVEKKWSAMTNVERMAFANAARALREQNSDIHLHAIVVKKENVQAHIRNDGNKLYNYMIRLSLLDRMAKYEKITMVPDPRSIKVRSGNSLHDYLLTELWFTKNAITELSTEPCESAKCAGIQFADMLAGAVQVHFEKGSSDSFNVMANRISLNRLFFGS